MGSSVVKVLEKLVPEQFLLQRRPSFTPLAYSVDKATCKEASAFEKEVASLLAGNGTATTARRLGGFVLGLPLAERKHASARARARSGSGNGVPAVALIVFLLSLAPSPSYLFFAKVADAAHGGDVRPGAPTAGICYRIRLLRQRELAGTGDACDASLSPIARAPAHCLASSPTPTPSSP